MDRRSSWLLLLALCVILQACAKKTVTHAPATMRVLTDGIVRSGSIEDPVEPRARHVQSDAALLEPVVRVSSRLIAAARRSEFGSQALALCWSIAVYEDHAPSRTFVTPDGAVLAIASGAIASGLGYAIWYAALPRLTATQAAVVQLTVPPLAAFGGVLWLGETTTVRLLAATLAILGGVGLTVTARRR